MSKVICAIRDRAVDGFMDPIVVPALGLAVRSFMDEVNRAESQMHAHPEDYDLYVLGMYDENNGALIPEAPRMVSVGKDVLRPARSD